MQPVLKKTMAELSLYLEKKADSMLTDSGIHLSYDSLSPNLYNKISLNKIAAKTDGVELDVGTLDIKYNTLALLKGRFEISGIRLQGIFIKADINAAIPSIKKIIAAFSSPSSGSGNNMAIELRSINIDLKLDENADAIATVSRADLLLASDGIIKISSIGTITANDASSRYGLSRALVPYSCDLVIDGPEIKVLADLSVDCNYGKLLPLQLSLNIDKTGIFASVLKIKGLEKLDLFWDFNLARFKADLAISSFRPSKLFSPSLMFKKYSDWIENSYTGRISVSTDFSIEGTTLSCLLSSYVPIKIEGGRPLVSIDVSGSWNSLEIKKLRIFNRIINAGIRGTASPSTLSAEVIMYADYQYLPNKTVSTEMQIFGSGSSWFAYAPTVSSLGTSLRDVTLSVDINQSSTSFYLDAGLPIPEGYSESTHSQEAIFKNDYWLEDSRLVIEGSASLGKNLFSNKSPFAMSRDEAFLEAVVNIGTFDMSSIKPLISSFTNEDIANIFSPLNLRGSVSVYSDFKDLSYNSPGLLFVYGGAIDAFGTIGFSGGLESIEIDSVDASVGGYSLSGNASMTFAKGKHPEFYADINVQDVPYEIEGALLDDSIVLSGDYGLNLAVKTVDNIFNLAVSMNEMPIPMFETVSFLTADISANFVSTNEWKANIINFEFTQPAGSIKSLPEISAIGKFDQNGGAFERLTFKDNISSIDGNMTFNWNLFDNFSVSALASLAGEDGESYSVNASYFDDGEIAASIKTTKAPLGRLNIGILKGYIDIDANVSGNIDNPLISFSFNMNEGQRQKEMIFASGQGNVNDGILALDSTKIRFADYIADNVNFEYKFDDGDSIINADLILKLASRSFSGKLSASGISQHNENEGIFSNYNISGGINESKWSKWDLGTLPLSVVLENGNTAIKVGPKNEVYLYISSLGDIIANVDKSIPISASVNGKIAKETISLDVNDIVLDASFLFDLIGLSLVQPESGIARGYLKIRGSITDPDITGEATPENLYFVMPDFIPAKIGPVLEPIYFTGRTMETKQKNVLCGNSRIYMDLVANIHNFIPTDFKMNIQTVEDDLAPVHAKIMGMDIEGNAMANLNITISRDVSDISGLINMVSGDVILTTELIKRKKNGQKSNLSGSLDLSLGKSVSAYFPSKRLPIIFGHTDPASHLNVSFDSAVGSYNIKGRAILRGGTVFYIQRNFYLKSASINFDESEEQFDPKITAEAERRISSQSGTVVVTLKTTDNFLSELSFKLESNPAMTETEISQLLGQGLLSETEGQIDIGKAIIENSDLIIPELSLSSLLEQNLQAALGLDLLVFRTQLVQRWIYDVSSDLIGSGSNMSLADYLDGTAIIAGKYLGEKLFLQGMLSLASDALETGGKLSLDSEISLEWAMPHFTLNWSMAPQDFNSLFMEDQKFSFMWNIPLK